MLDSTLAHHGAEEKPGCHGSPKVGGDGISKGRSRWRRAAEDKRFHDGISLGLALPRYRREFTVTRRLVTQPQDDDKIVMKGLRAALAGREISR